MLIRFTSVATGPVVMFGDVAKQLIKMLGSSDRLPNAIRAQDIPDAIRRLKERLATEAANVVAASKPDEERQNKDDSEPPIALSVRAVPLIDMLERAGAADAPVMWEKV